MRRFAVLAIAMAAFAVAGAALAAQTQATFKVPFKFESGTNKFPAGEYVISRAADGQVTLKQVATGKETAVPVIETLKPAAPTPGGTGPTPPSPGPTLVFHEVGNFEPSYTEYFTVYVLAEVWLAEGDGCLIRRTKGAHKDKLVKGELAK